MPTPEFPIPKSEQDNVAGFLWFIIRELEGTVDGTSATAMRKNTVESGYNLWNRLFKTDHKPVWLQNPPASPKKAE